VRSEESEAKSQKWGDHFPDSAFRIPNFKRKLLGLAMLALGSLAATPGEPARTLLWPLAIREGITSSFGEYRRTHFHGGVDMRTHQEEGWACLAPADGKVTRLRREPGGYGRVLYLDLDDGRTIVYGHVCRFENEKLHLDDTLYRACERAGSSFPGDITLDPPMRVKAGDTVCYSGELGIGTPHLHFEVRRGDEQLDPFVEGLPLPEGVGAPFIAGVTFEPQDASGTVDGGFAPIFVPAIRTAEGYKLARTVSVGGAVDLFLSAGDHLGVSTNTTGVPSITASLDGTVFSRMDLKRISLAHFKESPALFAPDFDRPGTDTYRLRKLPWITVGDFSGDGLPDNLNSGKHALDVTASNRAGHSALLTGTLMVERALAEGRLALPGSGYKILGHEITPAGLVLTLSRSSREGVTPVSIGGHPLRDLRVEENGKISALIPRGEIPSEGSPVVVGGVASSFLVASGPGRITVGSVRLNLPARSVGTAASASTPSGMPPGSAVRLAVGPYWEFTRAERSSWTSGPARRSVSGRTAFTTCVRTASRLSSASPSSPAFPTSTPPSCVSR
jgi:murein DD-endopeptidase MepM/ murein hydrolase activator NlpD